MMSLHHDDIYNVIPFLAIVYLTKSFADESTLVELMKYFLYARTAQTAVVFFDLPSILFGVTSIASVYVQFLVCHDLWDFPKSVDISNKQHLLVLIMAKSVFTGVWVAIMRISGGDGLASAGAFWFNDDELVNPEKHWGSEVQRGINVQRNNAENENVFVLACLILGVSGVPLSLIYRKKCNVNFDLTLTRFKPFLSFF